MDVPNMTSNTIGFATYQPDPEDLCSLCGGNFGKAAMVDCKDKIHICMECVDILGVIKKERYNKKRDEAVKAMVQHKDDPVPDTENYYHAIYDAIAAGKIPHIRID